MVVLVDSNPSEDVAGTAKRWLAVPRGVVRFLLGNGPRHLWVLSLLLLVVTSVWAYLDPFVEWAILGSDFIRDLLLAGNVNVISTTDWEGVLVEVGWRSTLFKGLAISSLSVFALLVFGTMGGPKLYRSLKSLLMLTTILCLWIGLFVSISNISWYGKQVRVSRFLSSFEPIVAELNEDWPKQDGQSPTIGPYKAYPLKDPTTLILLTSPPLTESEMRLTSVIRSDEGALRFSLAGSEVGDWLEWHPQGSKPSSLVPDGFQLNRNLSRTSQLGDRWYLVRYGQ